MQKRANETDLLRLKLAELDQIFQVSLDLLKKARDPDQLLDALLAEYMRRFAEIPGTRLLPDLSAYPDETHREKVRALMLYAEVASLLKENADYQADLREKNRHLAAISQKQKQTNRQLKALNAHYLNMLGFVSHELRSPLISILGFAELLEEGYLGELNFDQLNSVQIIIRVTRNLIDMIRNYLDLAKIESGALRMSWQRVLLQKDIVQPLIKELAGQLINRNMQIEQTNKGNTPDCEIEGDPELLKIAFRNLFSNAIKYGRPRSTISFTLLNLDKTFYFSLVNEGKGVPKNKIGKLFQKFTQAMHTDPELQRGTGLGLFNTRCIIRAHGGKVWAESEENKWFKVCVVLPRKVKKKPKTVKIVSRAARYDAQPWELDARSSETEN